jgi:signal transduction histidine kinase
MPLRAIPLRDWSPTAPTDGAALAAPALISGGFTMRIERRLQKFHHRRHGVLAGFACAGIAQRLAGLRAAIEQRWCLSLAVDLVDPQGIGALSPSVGDELYAIATEAAVNAARHAEAALVRIRLRLGGDTAILTVEDDGHGFPFTGKYGLQDLLALGTGPRWLMAHVAALGGALTLHSRPDGTRLEVSLPCGGRSGRELAPN